MTNSKEMIKTDSTIDTEKEQQFHPYRLLGVIALVTGTLAVICYGLQVHFLG